MALFCFFITNIFLPSYLNGFSYSLSINFYELIENESFDMIFESRIEDPVFKKRILIYFMVKHVSNFLEIDFQLSYNLLFLTSLFFFFKYVFKVTKSFGIKEQNLVNSSIFLLSFPVFFLPTPLISGFEDMLQWALSMMSFYFYINKKYILLSFFLVLALLCRETSFVLILVFYLYRRFTIIEFVLFTLIISLFMLIFINLGEVKEASEFLVTKRFYAWKDNFNSIEKILNNLTLIFISCFIPMILLWKENNLFLRKLFESIK